MSKHSLTRGGVASNLDLTMDPAARAEALKDERAAALVEEAIKESDARGGDGFQIARQDELDAGLKMNLTRHDEHEARETGQSFTRPLGIVVDPAKPNGWGWSVTPDLAEAMEQGYRCPCCLQPIRSDSTVCTWLYPRTSDMLGCGYSFTLDQNLGWKAADQVRSKK